jgi:hypothetical protein
VCAHRSGGVDGVDTTVVVMVRARRWWCWVVRAAHLGMWCGRRSWGGGGGRLVAAVVLAGGPAGPLDFFYLENFSLPRAKWPHGTRVPRASEVALSKEAFAGPAVPSGLCREFPLGTGCAESIRACAERSSLSAQPQIPVVIGWPVCLDPCIAK